MTSAALKLTLTANIEQVQVQNATIIACAHFSFNLRIAYRRPGHIYRLTMLTMWMLFLSHEFLFRNKFLFSRTRIVLSSPGRTNVFYCRILRTKRLRFKTNPVLWSWNVSKLSIRKKRSTVSRAAFSLFRYCLTPMRRSEKNKPKRSVHNFNTFFFSHLLFFVICSWFVARWVLTQPIDNHHCVYLRLFRSFN